MSELFHYGMPRRSGRYPWGSGKKPQRNLDIYQVYKQLHSRGFAEADIAKEWGMSTTQLRALRAIGHNEWRANQVQIAQKFRDKGYGYSEIGRRMGVNESVVRSYLDESKKIRQNLNGKTAATIKDFVDKYRYVDIGDGTEISLGVTPSRMKTAVQMLKDMGYQQHSVYFDQLGTTKKTQVKCLIPPDSDYQDLLAHKYEIKPVSATMIDTDGVKLAKREPIQNIDASRVWVRYVEDGGVDRGDGLIEIRRGCEDLNLGNAGYAQVRIGIKGSHYAKGMAMYVDDEDFPPGVDIIFNTNKHKGTPYFGPKDNTVFKPQKIDETTGKVSVENPFGASIKDDDDLEFIQTKYVGKDGKTHLSAINVVNEEGDVGDWKRALSSQFYSKQPVKLAQNQLKQKYAEQAAEFEKICNLTNPTVKKALLEKFAESCDAAAVDLKAAALPGQTANFLLPEPAMKETEVYAPNYTNGTRVVLVRFPHASRCEIPELVVNNNVKKAKSHIGNAVDAIGINPKVAQQLSGADFDGDSVLVIPANNPGGKVKIRTQKYFEGLKGFDPQEAYPGYEGMKKMDKKTRGKQMGIVSNLITDMTLKEAPEEHLVRAIRHSMVVIDAEKHGLNWKQSEVDNNIDELKRIYQERGDGKYGGAGTIVSRAKSIQYVDKRAARSGINAYNTDPETGEIIDRPDKDLYYWKPHTNRKTGEVTFTRETRRDTSTKMAEARTEEDVYKLTSGGSKDNPGHPMEAVCAEFAISMKKLANSARKEYLATDDIKKNPEAAEKYKDEVDSLMRKVRDAQANRPLERQAQILGNKMVEQAKAADPDMDWEHIQKARGQAISTARKAVGSGKKHVEITDREWEAIQAGAIAKTNLEAILSNANMDKVKQLAMPRENSTELSAAKVGLIKALAANYTQAEIADRTGLSTSQIAKAIKSA